MFKNQHVYLYFAPVGERSTAIGLSVCLCVCLSVCLSVCEHISGTAGAIFTQFCMQIPCRRGSVLFWRRCDMSCTSGFMDDLTFGHNWPYGDYRRCNTGAESDVYKCLVFITCFTQSSLRSKLSFLLQSKNIRAF